MWFVLLVLVVVLVLVLVLNAHGQRLPDPSTPQEHMGTDTLSPPSDHFQDLQGLLLIELYEGSVTIERIFAETYLSDERYMDSRSIDVTLVPEPSVGILLSIGIGFLLCRRPGGMVDRPIVAGQWLALLKAKGLNYGSHIDVLGRPFRALWIICR